MKKVKVNTEAGFTLIEVLVAMVIVAIGLLAVATMPVTVMRGNNVAQRVTEASFGAMDQLDQLMVLDNNEAELTAGNHSRVITANDGVRYTVAWNVTNLDTSRKNVAVIVSWTDRGAAKQAQFAYIKTSFM